mmetsp:Transcript_34673/g.87614  ORF Transcript_34673/g.87614 Transcript_34673/m.87614 type:complete len:150 (-) Transcript_34673:25-474(-)|eukprot:CAMPEP_0173436262 /NCGR_PEP_ID=MMETSP1357-20121228/15850_1 /TAXON_ID=77926 /ORGANISM="Hemiselmis rufescens, Strain PCC563" /LENGTH=149 /DNA_ID=CAMNT_0014401327 /DNA_START=104 /DNA_END=553 /DNA_ORIENTATION=-
MSKDAEWITKLFEAARHDKIVPGSPVPKSWVEGVQYTLSTKHRFQVNEVCVVGRSDGSRSLGRIRPTKKQGDNWFQLELHRTPEYYVDVGPAHAGGKSLHKMVEAQGLGKLHSSLQDVITSKGEGMEEEDVLGQMEAARDKFTRVYSGK